MNGAYRIALKWFRMAFWFSPPQLGSEAVP
jgi:hypothetical protein